MPTSKLKHMRSTFCWALNKKHIFFKSTFSLALVESHLLFHFHCDIVFYKDNHNRQTLPVIKTVEHENSTVTYSCQHQISLTGGKGKKKKKNHELKYHQRVRSRVQVSLSFWLLWAPVQYICTAAFKKKRVPDWDRLWQLRYAPQQYTGVCLQLRRPLHKALILWH